MRTTVLILCGAAAVLGSIATWLHVTNDRLRAQRDVLVSPPASGSAPATRAAASAGATPVREGDMTRLRAEIRDLEARVSAASAQQPKRNTDITRDLVNVGDLRNAGRDTPAAAFETLVWASVHGDESLSGLIAISPVDHAQTLEYLRRIGSSRTPEQVAGILFADELLRKVERVQVLESAQVDPTHVNLKTKTADIAESEHKTTIPMVLGPGGWQLQMPEGMARGLEQTLNYSPAAAR